MLFQLGSTDIHAAIDRDKNVMYNANSALTCIMDNYIIVHCNVVVTYLYILRNCAVMKYIQCACIYIYLTKVN